MQSGAKNDPHLIQSENTAVKKIIKRSEAKLFFCFLRLPHATDSGRQRRRAQACLSCTSARLWLDLARKMDVSAPPSTGEQERLMFSKQKALARRT